MGKYVRCKSCPMEEVFDKETELEYEMKRAILLKMILLSPLGNQRTQGRRCLRIFASGVERQRSLRLGQRSFKR